ncbi:MAG TPA: cytochrome c biogenesis protein ResB [Pseudogracilibacillus sp.]|nr:cytochrome c biogenesis protein ResB [Pseudogracilibacillus sp.]
MNKLKCECGHVNPEGTVLCEACGKPVEGNQHIDGNDQTKLLNMRYDGTARRSQTYNRSIIDKTWNFFSSVKVGVWLIVIALIASGLGTIYPQAMYIPAEAENRDPAVFYEASYGLTGKIYYQLGLHEMYSSWWYMILIALIGVSLVICSIDRFVPLRRALKNQKPKRHSNFLNRQRLYSQTEKVTEAEKTQLIQSLKKQRYKITNENGNILAEKNRFSRWGPYVNHIGLIIILIASLLRMTPLLFLDDYIWIREGEEKVIPSTEGQYYIKNNQFILETYDETDEKFKEAIEKTGEPIPKNYQTDVVISKVANEVLPGEEPELESFLTSSIQMNKPIKFDGYTLYQSGYQLGEFKSMTFHVVSTDDESQSLGKIKVDNLMSPERHYELDNGIEINIKQYFPDYEMDNGEPRSTTKFPKNPAFLFEVIDPEEELVETSFLSIGQNIDATGENKYALRLDANSVEMQAVSGITVRRDYTLPLYIVGAAIFMIGVIQGMYWQHRRIWLNPEDEGIAMAAHTNKNWFGLKKDIEKAIEDTNINMVVDQEELEREKQEKEKAEQEA